MKSQLDRILNSDINQYAVAVSERLSSIDHLEQCLTERSNFINDFQHMLKQQLQSTEFKHKNKLKAIPKEYKNPKVQPIDPLEAHKQNIHSLIGNNYTKNNNPTTKQQKIKTKLNKNVQKLSQLKKDIKLFKTSLRQEFNTLNSNIVTIISESFYQYIKSIRKSDGKQISAESQLQNEMISNIDYQLQLQSQLSSEQLYETDRNIADQSYKKCLNMDISERYHNVVSKNTNVSRYMNYPLDQEKSLRIKGSEYPAWNHYKCELGEPQSFSNFHSIELSSAKKSYSDCEPSMPTILRKQLRNQSFDLPQFQTIHLSGSTFKEGFGIFKLGSEVLYKGHWLKHKFHGKGKLTLHNYTYEGYFKDGLFDGCGTLTMANLIFIGEFKANQANGEGTIRIGLQELSGRWQNNRLVQKY